LDIEGNDMQVDSFDTLSPNHMEEVLYHRAKLVETLANFDDQIADAYLNCDGDAKKMTTEVSPQMLKVALRTATIR
jgi:hypothetical protein